MKRRSYILLEILISLLLISTCFVPFIHYPYRSSRKQLDQLFNTELQKDALLTVAEVKEKLYKNEISWADLQTKKVLSEEKINVIVGKEFQRSCKRKITLSGTEKKKGKDETENILVTVTVHYELKKEKYKIFIKSQFYVVRKPSLTVPPTKIV